VVLSLRPLASSGTWELHLLASPSSLAPWVTKTTKDGVGALAAPLFDNLDGTVGLH
jgi:hypothetical protein